MRTFLLGFLIWGIFTIFARWYFFCEVRQVCDEMETPPPATRAMTLNLMDGDTAILEGYEQLDFIIDSTRLATDFTENNLEFLSKVSKYLKSNPDKNLSLTGRFLASEKDFPSGIYENLGLARAALIEEFLESDSLEQERITIDYQMVTGTVLEEPVSFSLYIPDKPDDYAKLQFRFEDMTFSDANFEFGSDVFKPGAQCIAYADSVKRFLDDNADIMLTIIGHTDSIDTEKFNHTLGLRRANNAADYFRELGITAPIRVDSQGELEPVAPNSKADGKDNPEGRQKNRRVNFKLDPIEKDDS